MKFCETAVCHSERFAVEHARTPPRSCKSLLLLKTVFARILGKCRCVCDVSVRCERRMRTERFMEISVHPNVRFAGFHIVVTEPEKDLSRSRDGACPSHSTMWMICIREITFFREEGFEGKTAVDSRTPFSGARSGMFDSTRAADGFPAFPRLVASAIFSY